MNKIKELLNILKNGGDKKKIENMIVFVVILVITIIAINAIWTTDKSKSNERTEDLSDYKKLASDDVKIKSSEEDDLEYKLEQILSNMEGVGKVNVLISYTQGSEIIPLQNETIKTSTIHEEDSDGGKRDTEEIDKSSEIVFANNTIETKTVVNPIIKGAIIIAQGASNANIKTNIVSAVEAITGLATYKIQVFEMKQ